jgi:hypothetical protein
VRHHITDPEEAARLLDEPSPEEGAKKAEAVSPIKLIDIETVIGGVPCSGRFYFRVPSIGEQIRIGQIKQMMLPGGSPDPLATLLVDQLAYLQVAIHFTPENPRPAWWNPTSFYDAQPISMLFGRCLDHEATFHARHAKHRSDAGVAGGTGEPDRAGEVPLGRKVQPPAQRRETLAGDDA